MQSTGRAGKKYGQLTEAIADRDKGLVFDSGNLSVGEYLDRWLDAVQNTVGERTWKRHESIVRLHIKPSLGRTKLAALNPLHVQSLIPRKVSHAPCSGQRQAHPYDAPPGHETGRTLAVNTPQPL